MIMLLLLMDCLSFHLHDWRRAQLQVTSPVGQELSSLMFNSHRYPEGHVFFEEGSAGTCAHIVKSGQIEITIQ